MCMEAQVYVLACRRGQNSQTNHLASPSWQSLSPLEYPVNTGPWRALATTLLLGVIAPCDSGGWT